MLITAFQAFGDHSNNPTMEIAKILASDYHSERIKLHTQVLPVERYACLTLLNQAVNRVKPSVVIALGLAANRDRITIERVALNLDDFPIADNAGHQPRDEQIIVDAPLALMSTLPVKAIQQRLQAESIASEISYSAGTYVCNHLFFGMQHQLKEQGVCSGFIHTPPITDALDLTTQCKAIGLAFETCFSDNIATDLIGGKIS
ncbi:pyroglutamyl-peptidase I family protein [Salinibius halmophilus]|uniref:pyroglutamyl-peptidase I family protein n=1 Tax=Salinibius halmophilus TaxID=1853216 RepID=UPI001314CAE3|nr:pyroglutamyl-peptidase I [Salinibius halmophilus]